MYLDYEVRIPDSRHGITRKPTRGITYIYYAYDRKYSSEKHYTVPKNTTIGKCLNALNQEAIESYFSGSSHVNGRSPVLCKKVSRFSSAHFSLALHTAGRLPDHGISSSRK